MVLIIGRFEQVALSRQPKPRNERPKMCRVERISKQTEFLGARFEQRVPAAVGLTSMLPLVFRGSSANSEFRRVLAPSVATHDAL